MSSTGKHRRECIDEEFHGFSFVVIMCGGPGKVKSLTWKSEGDDSNDELRGAHDAATTI
jgi:hypothetical protein